MPIEAMIVMVAILSVFLLCVVGSLGLSYFVLAIVLVRPSCDPLFGLAKSVLGGEAGPGGAVNALVIGLGLCSLIQKHPLVVPAPLPLRPEFLLCTSPTSL